MNDTTEPVLLEPGEDVQIPRNKYFDLSRFTIPVLDFSIGRFGGIALMDENETPGPLVAKLPAGRRLGKKHIDHIISIWRQRTDLAPLNVYDTAHEIEVVEGTLHINFIDGD